MARDSVSSAQLGELKPQFPGQRPNLKLMSVAKWLAIGALVLTAMLAVIYVVSTYIVLFVVGTGAGAVGLALAVRARRGGRRGIAGWALAFSIIALLADVVLIVVVVVSIAFRPQLSSVEVRAQGDGLFRVTYGDDTSSDAKNWTSSGNNRFNTWGSVAEITVAAVDGGERVPVSCQILWNGIKVVDQSSDRGIVTCRYIRG